MTPGGGGLETEVETKKHCPPSTRLYHHRPPANDRPKFDPLLPVASVCFWAGQ